MTVTVKVYVMLLLRGVQRLGLDHQHARLQDAARRSPTIPTTVPLLRCVVSNTPYVLVLDFLVRERLQVH